MPTRSQLAEISLTELERYILGNTISQALKGVPGGGITNVIRLIVPEEQRQAILVNLHEKGALCWEEPRDGEGPETPSPSYLAGVLVGTADMIVYTYHAESRTRLKIMWERALDRADAAGEPVDWTGDQLYGIDESIPVPEITCRVHELHGRGSESMPGTQT